MKLNIASFIRPQGLKHLLMRRLLMMYLNQSIVLLYPRYKNHLERVQAVLLIQP